MKLRLLAAAVLLSSSIAFCGGNTTQPQPDGGTLCVPGASVACTGVGGCSGAQVCNSAGTAYGACDCGPSDGGSDASNDAGTDAPVDASGDAGSTAYGDITNSINWSTFDFTETFDAGLQNYGIFEGAAFDGRYIYYVPTYGPVTVFQGNVVRYDTHGSFISAASWSYFDMSQLNTKAKGYWGAIFDGKYLYFVPLAYDGTPSWNSLVVRYDTTATFTDANSWNLFDMANVNASAKGYAGGTFDGQYVYFAPYSSTANGLAVRYDTKASFASGASWQTYDMTQTNASATQGDGAVFDGRYVYYVPTGGSGKNGVLARYDTTGTFTSTNAWQSFDLKTVNPASAGFIGGTFDGRYVYFIPNGGSASGVLTRYDTTAPFASGSSYETFDMTSVNAALYSFAGGIFDGRYVYCIPLGNNDGTRLVRYDTTAPFTSTSSYTSFDLKAYTGKVAGWFGGAFDGEFVYLSPFGSSSMIRFDAKTPPSMPSAYHGSFF